MGDYSSLYKYEKYEVFGDEIVPLGIFSVDGDGTMPVVVKYDCDQECGCQEPIYRWIQTEDTICVYVPPTPVSAKFRLTLSDSTTVSAECDSTSAITSGEVATQYSGTVVSAEIGDCVNELSSNTFKACSSLTSIDIPNGVTTIGDNAFKSCLSLTSIDIPSSVTSIGSYTFDGCTGLTSCTIGSGVTRLGAQAFRHCLSLQSIDIPNSVTSIGNSAFTQCSSITSVTIGSGVTFIGRGVFSNCSSLISIDIPSGVTSIGYGAFQYCSGLTSITVNATTPPTLSNSNAFTDTNNCPIYVPSASVDTYKVAEGWSNYADRIQAIV